MNIELLNDELVITADRRYIAQLRELPDRRWDSASKRWFASYTRENYAAMAALGWPVSHIQPPTRSALFIELVRKDKEVGKFLAVYVPGKAEYIELCRKIPEHRAWSTANRCWLCRPTRDNLLYLKKMIPAAQWSEAAQTMVDSIVIAPPPETFQPISELVAVASADFKFKTKPYQHQLTAFALSRDKEAFALMMEQRTGKTKVVIDTAAYLRSQGKIDAVMVVAPNSVKDVWPEELLVHLPEWVDYSVVVDGPGKRADVESLMEDPKTKLKWLVTNVESLSSKDREDAYKMFLARHRTLMVLDEFTRFKNPTAKRTKALLRLKSYTTYRRILSGTPITQSPLDIYAPFKWLDGQILGFSSWVQCKLHHAIMGGFNAKQVVGYVKLDEIASKIAPHSFRVLTAQCFDLPPVVYKKRVVDLNSYQRRIYDDLRDELVAELEAGQRITAPHSFTKLLRLSQITGGFVVPDLAIPDGEDYDDLEWNALTARQIEKADPVQIQGDNHKIDAVIDIIDDLPETEKVVIWAVYIPEILLLEKTLKEKYGEDSVVTFHGAVTNDDRTLNRHKFQGTLGKPHDPKCRFFIGQVETGGIGIKLSIANTAIYYSNSFSLETRQQTEFRILDDQKIAKCVYDLVAKDTLDRQRIEILRKKKRFADSITGDSWREWL